MKRSRTEVGRWRMLRQVNRRKARWLEAQSRRNMRILQRHALLFVFPDC
ncbi:MAG: YciY family protein [Klebsiella sp.]|nr:YciY family protein [Klebsiella sp.]